MTPAEAARSLPALVSDVRLLLFRWFDTQVAHLGLTISAWQVLGELYRSEALTQTELAHAVGMAKSPLGKLLDRLEAGGWIRREADPADRRVNRVVLTDRIEPLLAPLTAVSDELTERALEGLTGSERRTLTELLEHVRQNMRRANEAPPVPVEGERA
ncbi:MAG: MarR family winged helix-turn-helix transcriptional regulator [Pseudomonadales bacterium]|jgi:DNA-binding MarR family transcriptional regulator|nr:MarR family winged helix-turn-helix transcriptional regulator [Pseudomonadales bacterium]